MRFLLPLALRVLFVVAGQTNRSIDDASGLVNYSNGIVCVGCGSGNLETPPIQLDRGELNNGTYSFFGSAGPSMEFKFTGTALYVFFALSPVVMGTDLTFNLDGVKVGSSPALSAAGNAAQYNVSVYTNTSIPDGPHTFNMSVAAAGMTQIPVTVPPPIPQALKLQRAVRAVRAIRSLKKKNPPVSAIAGAVVGALAAIVLFIVALIALRHRRAGHNSRRNSRRNTPAIKGVHPLLDDTLLEPKESVVAGTPSPPVEPPTTEPIESPPTERTSSPETQDDSVKEEVRILREQLEELRQQSPPRTDEVTALREELQLLRQQVQGGNSSTAVETENDSLGRSLSTMKREQTRALQEHGRGGDVTDMLVHTDSGLRLTAGRAVDELPPTYAAD
ncbi:hypothetical protein DFH06DRAFT_1396873 [Mycena polygramma]|nr:hypothetical protein DFH06DRAFT_1396873 [Mycena polygramma]